MVKTQKNLTLECCRMVAAVFVVFLHVPFPGEFGALVQCLSRFAVPMFFAISGWYSFGTEPGRLLKRAGRIWLLELGGILLVLTWKCVQGRFDGIRVLDSLLWRLPDARTLGKWLLFQVDPFSGHLWYLSAAVVCYLVLAVYVRVAGKNYRTLYAVGGMLLAGHFAMAEFSGYTGISVTFTTYRNAWFFGIPMFAMGLGLRQLREGLSDRSWENAAAPAGILLFGVLLSVAEWRYFGGYDLPVGTVIAVAGLMLLTAARPRVPWWLEAPAGSFGFVSTGVYLIHLTVCEICSCYFTWRPEAVPGAVMPWVMPLLVAGISTGIALAAYLAVRIRKRFA